MKNINIPFASPPIQPALGGSAPNALRSLEQTLRAAERYRERAGIREKNAKLKKKGLFLALDDPMRIVERAERKSEGAVPRAELETRIASFIETSAPSINAALERIIGKSDLLPVSYFPWGEDVAHAVGRVVNTDDHGNHLSYGTAFLVAPDVVLTNHHVLPNAAVAGASFIEFNYQVGKDGQVEHVVSVPIDPSRYFSNKDLDFALAGVVFKSTDHRPSIWLPLIVSEGKIVNEEPVTIVQHPNGGYKQVALRNNKVTDVLNNFLHYTTDTMPGASGAPVFNDQWEVVALHHSGVPQVDTNGQILSTSGTPWNAAMGEDTIDWVANEGVRISQIMAFIGKQTNLSPAVKNMIQSVSSQEMLLRSSPDSLRHITSHEPGNSTGTSEQIRKTIPMGTEVQCPQANRVALDVVPVNITVPSSNLVDINIRVYPTGTLTPAEYRGQEGLLSNVAGKVGRALGHGVDTVADWISGSQQTKASFITELNAGDVLLYNGTGAISDAIKFFTNSDVSHAALYLGEGQMIGEAVGSGLIRDTGEQSFPGHNWVVVHRLHNPHDMTPVVSRGDFYLNKHLKYSYQQIVLLAILLLIKKIRPSGIRGKMVQAVSVAAANALNKLLESGKDLMICSEFVYRSYDEAVPGRSANPYNLQIPGIALESSSAAGTRSAGVDPDSLLMKLQSNPSLLIKGFKSAKESALAEQLPLSQDELEEQAEKLVAEYLAEQRHGRQPSMVLTEDFVPDEQVTTAVSRFAIALQSVRHRASTGAAPDKTLAIATQEALSLGQLPPALQALVRTPADFVTPGDLRKSPTLFEAGRIF